MGDYSRNTFSLTNVMHEVLTENPVADSRHYVGVRLQQAVPMLDADWNELEDIRRIESQINLMHFFGDGIPSGNIGFQIGAVTEDNDFTINLGMALVSGVLVFNPHSALTYLGQATVFGADVDLLAPPPAASRDDLVYLDVWEEESGASGIDRNDERLVNPMIGVETCRRIERRWLVRVEPGATDLSSITREPGHYYMALARLRREAGQLRIPAQNIYDLRRTDVNVAQYLKIPLYVERGVDIVDSERLADVLDALRDILTTRLEAEQLFINTTDALATTLVHFSLQHVMQICSTGALQARTNNLTNEDALQVMQTLVLAQRAYLDSLTAHGVGGAAMDAFVIEYGNRLTPVEDALAEPDLLGAYLAQQALNSWLSADVGTLPEGGVTLTFVDINPQEPLVAGTTYTVFVEITSGVTSDQSDEVFDVTAALTSDLWQVSPPSAEITLDNVGGASTSGVVQFEVTPHAANLTSDLSVVASVRRNPTIVTSQLPLELQLGVEPLAGAVMQYAGPPLNTSGRLELAESELNNGFGSFITFAFNNNTAASHTYEAEWFITLSVGDETGWVPLSASPSSNTVIVPADSSGGLSANVRAPTGGLVAGNIGTLQVTLIGDNGPLDPADQQTIQIEFEVV